MSHKEIVRHMHEEYQISSWWSQIVTVTYEQKKGLRKKHERPDGYSISISKIVSVPINVLYEFWNDDSKGGKWLIQGGLNFRSRNLNRNLHLNWIDANTSVDVNFYHKGQDKSQVVVQHNKLSSLAESEKLKYYWKAKLERLISFCC